LPSTPVAHQPAPGLKRRAWSARTVWPVFVCWAGVVALAAHRSTDPRFLGRYSASYLLLVVAGAMLAALLTLVRVWPGVVPRAALGNFAALAVSSVATLVATELFLRVVDPLGLSYYSEMTRYILDRLPDPELKYRHRRSFERTYQGVSLRFNERGLRDDPIAPKAPGEFRVVLLGDSQTLGWGVEREDTWAVRLQRILGERSPAPLRVINAGVASYETRQQSRYLLREGFELEPDLIVLLYLDNDLEIDDRPYDPWRQSSLRGKRPGEVAELLARRTRLYQLWFYARQMRTAFAATRYEPLQVGIPQEFEPSMREQPGWKASMESLRTIARAAADRGVPFAVVHFDWIEFPFSRELDRAVREAVAPVPVAYTPEWFRGRDVRDYFNSPVDSHPNAEGHRVLAEHIAVFLRDEGLVPSAQQPVK
jgi:lysophospholipase L1-like esterase